MIFDKLWRAEQRASKESKRIRDYYEPLMEAAEKAENEQDYQSALSAMLLDRDLNDEPEIIKTEMLITQARKLGIPLPPKPTRESAESNEDPNWYFNRPNGNWYFTENKELELRQQVRRESDERFAHFWNRFGGILSALTFLVLFANAYILWRQTKIMRTQANIMEKTLPVVGQQADAATSAAHTAETTLQESQKSFQIEQRPYLVAETPTFAVPPASTGHTYSNITIRNIGKTPAVKMKSAIILIRHEGQKITPGSVNKFPAFLEGNFQELTHQLRAAYLPGTAMLVREDLAPNAAVFSTRELTPPLLQGELPELTTGELTLFLIGITRYSDAYSGSYETQFCYIYYGSPGIWHNCDAHNFIK